MTEQTDKKHKRLSPAEWAAACAAWELGDTTLEALEETYGIRADTFSKKFAAAGVVKGSKVGQVQAQVEQQIMDSHTEAAAEEALKLAAKKKATKEDCYTWTEHLQKLAMVKIQNAIKDRTPLGAIKGELQAIEKAIAIIAMGRKERFEILGLDKEEVDPNDLPELIIRELTPHEVADLQSQSHMDEDDIELADLGGLEEEVVEEG